MKKLFLITSIFFISYNLSAQVYYGFKVGANATNFNGDLENNTFKPSFHVGAVAEIQLSDAFSIQPELLYSDQGFQNKDNNLLKNHYRYLNLPIMAKYFINSNITIDAGPQIGYLLDAKTSDGEYIFESIKDNSKTFDYGFNLGATYEFDDGLNISLRYNYGFADVTKNSTLKATNSVIQVSFGYKFY